MRAHLIAIIHYLLIVVLGSVIQTEVPGGECRRKVTEIDESYSFHSTEAFD